MGVSEYRKKILERVDSHRLAITRDIKNGLDIANSDEKLAELISIMSDNGTTAEQKTEALSMFNAINNFSSKTQKFHPEIVNILRGQIDDSDQNLRLSAISTLAAFKDDVVQERLLEELNSDKPEEERLVPTARAISMLGFDEKALPLNLLRKISLDPPNEESREQAIRHMPSDPVLLEDLISLMKNDEITLEVRKMIPQMVSEANSTAFLKTAEEMLKVSGGKDPLDLELVKAVGRVAATNESAEVKSAKDTIAKLSDDAPDEFQSFAAEFINKDD